MYFDAGYGPFGEDCGSSGTTDKKFAGNAQDVFAGLFDTPNRMYAANQGHWLIPDPAGINSMDTTDPQSFNRYAYVSNNSVNGTDTSGLTNKDIFDNGDPGDQPTWNWSLNF